jgi:phosphate-selective porin OprO/OprP
MERTKSSLHTLFIERAALDTFTPKRNLGAQITHYGNQGSLSYGIFTDSFQSNTNKDTIAFTSRATYAWHLPQGTLHGGMAGTWRKMEKVGFSALPDTSGTNIASVQTGTIRDIDRMMQGGVELAYGWRNVLLEGEYITSHLQRDQNMDAALYGWYAQAAWMLSGEPYRYSTKKDTVFQSVTPNKPFSLSQDTWGAFEWGVRYQTLSLSDAAIQGGQMYAVTTGLNWYPNTAWKLAANVTYNHSDAESVTPYDNPVVAALRLRVAF